MPRPGGPLAARGAPAAAPARAGRTQKGVAAARCPRPAAASAPFLLRSENGGGLRGSRARRPHSPAHRRLRRRGLPAAAVLPSAGRPPLTGSWARRALGLGQVPEQVHGGGGRRRRALQPAAAAAVATAAAGKQRGGGGPDAVNHLKAGPESHQSARGLPWPPQSPTRGRGGAVKGRLGAARTRVGARVWGRALAHESPECMLRRHVPRGRRGARFQEGRCGDDGGARGQL